MKTKEQLKEKISELHLHEDELNVENGKYDKMIADILSKKKKLAKRISNNVKYRHRLIDELYTLKKSDKIK